MPHIRKRHLEYPLQRALAYSPLVGVIGHRQVGKTTLVENAVAVYQSFDRRSVRDESQQDPDGFLAGFSRFPVGLDEVQSVEAMFPALKERVRQNKRPGQFILTGSVRFTSRRAIRESLTGRILLLEMLPMTAAECCEQPPAQLLLKLARADRNPDPESLVKGISRQRLRALEKSFQTSLVSGGLPGICFIRNAALRSAKFEAQLETILQRDMQLILQTTLSYQSLRQAAATLAMSQGEPLEWAELARKTRISIPTLRKVLAAFEGLFLIRFVETVGGERRPTFFFEDQGEAAHLVAGRGGDLSAMTNALYSHIRVPFLTPFLQGDYPWRVVQYRTRGGAFVPFVFMAGKKALGIMPALEEHPSPQHLGSAKSFLKAFPGAKVAIVHPFARLARVTDRIYTIPLGYALA